MGKYRELSWMQFGFHMIAQSAKDLRTHNVYFER